LFWHTFCHSLPVVLHAVQRPACIPACRKDWLFPWSQPASGHATRWLGPSRFCCAFLSSMLTWIAVRKRCSDHITGGRHLAVWSALCFCVSWDPIRWVYLMLVVLVSGFSSASCWPYGAALISNNSAHTPIMCIFLSWVGNPIAVRCKT